MRPYAECVQSALSGYAVIWAVIAVGFICAHVKALGENHRAMLSNVAFLVASPFLLFQTVAQASLAHLFAEPLLISVIAIVVAGGTYLATARTVFHQGVSGATIGTLCSAYTNAGNLGLPIAALILGDMTWMAPIILVQTCLLQPTAIAILDIMNRQAGGKRKPWWFYATLPFRNPITVGSLLGLVVNLSGLHFPSLVWQPITMIGDVAVPAMLIAFGISLRLDPPPGRGPHLRELVEVVVIKCLWQPVVAWVLAAFVFHLSTANTLAVVVIAALPTAQNVYMFASRYQARVLLARDAIFTSTILSVPVILGASALLG